MRKTVVMLILLVCVTGFMAADSAGQEAGVPAKPWATEPLKVLTGFEVPECVAPDPAHGVIYISNIEAAEDAYWDDDGEGFISQAMSEGDMKKLRWLDSRSGAVIHSPKGMCILNGVLYFADNTRLMRCAPETTSPPEPIEIPGAKRLNDVATDGKAIYVSDTQEGVIFRVDPKGGHTVIPGPSGANGIAFHKGQMYCVSWDAHDVYEVDPEGKNAPKPFGLADHFKNLDGIEVLDDGTFLVSDFVGNKVCTITPDRKTVATLVEIESPADIGLDRTRGLLYVPKFEKNEVAVLKLRQP
jgi:sugar lactone lactonase YvrE